MPTSRQLRWQRIHRARGLCTHCSLPALPGQARCPRHHRERLRQPRLASNPVAVRTAVELRTRGLPLRTIAQALSVSLATVWRLLRAVGS